MMSELFTHNPTAVYSPRRESEYYPTDPAVIKSGFESLPDGKLISFDKILEPGAGEDAPFLHRAYLNYPNAKIYDAVELRDCITPKWIDDAKLSGKSNITYFNNTSYLRDVDDYGAYDLIVGNPPFGDVWEQAEEKKRKENRKIRNFEKIQGWHPDYWTPIYKSPMRPIDNPKADAEAFLRHSMDLLQDGGFLMFLLRLGFYSGIKKAKGVFKEYRPYLINVICPRPSFNPSRKGTDATEYAFFYFQKGYYPKRAEIDFCLWKDI